MLKVPYLLEKGEGIPHKQIIKALGSEGVSVEEFFNDISRSNMKYSCALPNKFMSLSLIKR